MWQTPISRVSLKLRVSVLILSSYSIKTKNKLSWVRLLVKVICRIWDLGLWENALSVCVCVGVYVRDPIPYLSEFRSKTTENIERLGRQARLGIEPVTFRLPV